MNRYRISTPAQSEPREVYNYIARFSESRADAMLDEFFEQFQVIADQPLLQGGVDEVYGTGLRVNVLRGYLIFYRPLPDGAEIANVMDSSRNCGPTG